MKRMYETACRQAGLSEEETSEIRKVFANDCARQRRRNRFMEESGCRFLSVSDPWAWAERPDPGEPLREDYQIPDTEADTGEEAVWNLELSRLRAALGELEEEERAFLLGLFAEGATVTRAAEEFGTSRFQAARRRDRLIRDLRRRMGVPV